MEPLILLGACLRLLVTPLVPGAEAYGVAVDGKVVWSNTFEAHQRKDVPAGYVGLLIDPLPKGEHLVQIQARANTRAVYGPGLVVTVGGDGDYDGDGKVGFSDFGKFSKAFGECNDGLMVKECEE